MIEKVNNTIIDGVITAQHTEFEEIVSRINYKSTIREPMFHHVPYNAPFFVKSNNSILEIQRIQSSRDLSM